MSKLISAILKMVLFVLFVESIGGWDLIGESFDSPVNSPTLEQVNRIERYTLERIKFAERKVASGKTYRPDDYFNDLRIIRSFADSIGAKGYSFNIHVGSLQNVLQSQVGRGVTYDQIEIAAKKYREAMEEKAIPKNGKTFKSDLFWEALNWLGGFYLSHLPFGFALLLIWYYQKRKSLFIRSPLSFLLAVLIYPVVIIVSWCQGVRSISREYYGSAVARQFKDRVFSLLDEDEIAVVSRFVAGHITRQALESELSRGRVARRSLAVAMFVTVLFVIVPQQILADSQVLSGSDNQVLSIGRASPPSVDISTSVDDAAPLAIMSDCPTEVYVESLIISYPDDLKKCCSDINEIDHIPLVGYYLFMEKYLITLIKGNGHEKSHNIICINSQP